MPAGALRQTREVKGMRLVARLASYVISNEQWARKKVLDNRQRTAVNTADMSKNALVGLLIGLALASVHLAEAQQPNKIARIGLLFQSSPSFTSPQIEALRQELRELGYLEGKNVAFENRYAEGQLDRLPALAGELVRAKVDVIVATSTPGVLAAKNATNEIPIVFHTINDPVETGVVASLARPGANITGLTMGGAELYGKRLELLKETIPKLSRTVFLLNPTTSAGQLNLKEALAAAEALKVQIQSLEVRTPEDIAPAFEAAIRAKSGAMLITQIPCPV